MTQITKQAQTLMLLASTSPKLSAVARSTVSDELKQVVNVAGMQPPRRRRLLTALHIARCLETTLREVINFHSIAVEDKHKNMGGYLSKLAGSSIIPNKIRTDCDSRVRVLRNRLAHGAGEYPTGDHQLNSAAQAANACIAFIL